MVIPQSARASANGTSTKNTQFQPLSQALQSRIVLALQYDPAKTAVVDNTLELILSPTQAAEKYGYGSQMHIAAIANYTGHGGSVEVWGCPLPAIAGGVAATGTIEFVGAATSAGVHTFYIHGKKIEVAVASGDSITDQGDALELAINNNVNLPVTALNAVGTVTLTAKWLGAQSNDIGLHYNLLQSEIDKAPATTTVTVVAIGTVIAGAGISDIAGAIDAIVDSSIWFTDLVTPLNSTTAMDLVLAAIGNPDSFTGLYGKLDYRPLTNWTGNVAGGSAGLTAAIAVGNARKNDCVNDYVQAPDYQEIPFEIAAYVCGIVAGRANDNAASHYEKLTASFLYGPVDLSEDWSAGANGYTARDTALKAGLSSIYTYDGSPVLGDICSFYHPDAIANPAFLFEVNKRKTWNIAKDVKADKDDPQRQGTVLVENANAASQQPKATDEDIEKSRIILLADQWESRGLLFASIFTKINTIAKINPQNPDRIDRFIPCILSGNVRIRDDSIEMDRNVTIVNVAL